MPDRPMNVSQDGGLHRWLARAMQRTSTLAEDAYPSDFNHFSVSDTMPLTNRKSDSIQIRVAGVTADPLQAPSSIPRSRLAVERR